MSGEEWTGRWRGESSGHTICINTLSIEMNPNKVKLVELNDDHALIKSLPEIEELCVEFFSLSSKSKL